VLGWSLLALLSLLLSRVLRSPQVRLSSQQRHSAHCTSAAPTPRLASCDQLNAAAAALNSTLVVAGGWTAAVLACPNAAVVSVVRSPLQRILHRTRHLRQPGARCAAAAGGTAHGATLHCTAAADGV
jgi:hypothetical protein